MIAPVVNADMLEKLLTESASNRRRTVVADVRWYLDGRDGQAAYAEGHIPGAKWVDLERDLAAHGDPSPTEGRHPLPTPAAFAAAMSALGIGDDTIVIGYDDTGGVTAGRLVVMLRMLGRDAAVLDGGLAGWIADGRPIATGKCDEINAPATFIAAEWPAERLASADDAALQAASGGVVLDARAKDRFSGEQAMIDPRPGHIPGARNAPWSEVLAGDGRFRDREQLLAHFQALGVRVDTDADASVDAPIAYCGSGVSACMNVLAMEHAGLPPARLYVGSWSGWSADPARPAELGDPWTQRTDVRHSADNANDCT